tara:strand:- start:2639 stop:2824 length:186 start_codon:yes stop_codon:yes gene_type:complete
MNCKSLQDYVAKGIERYNSKSQEDIRNEEIESRMMIGEFVRESMCEEARLLEENSHLKYNY